MGLVVLVVSVAPLTAAHEKAASKNHEGRARGNLAHPHLRLIDPEPVPAPSILASLFRLLTLTTIEW